MARKRNTKGKVQHNKRVRFCSLDYYRTLVTSEQTNIEGIAWYSCTDSSITVVYVSELRVIYDVSNGEKQLKQVIKVINAYIGGRGNGAQ